MKLLGATHARPRACHSCARDRGVFPCQPDWAWLLRSFDRSDLLPILSDEADDADVMLDYSDRVCRCLLVEGGDAPSIGLSFDGQQAYLATPAFAAPIDAMPAQRRIQDRLVLAAGAWTRLLASYGLMAVSPVILASAVARVEGVQPDPLSEAFWRARCLPILRNSHVVIVPRVVGWDQSLFVWRDVTWALGNGLTVHLMSDHNVGQEGMLCL